MSQEKSLSQKEIDALLAVLPGDGSPMPSASGGGGGAVPTAGGGLSTDRFIGSARTYDFRSPDKFSKEQIRTLQMIHENFARRLTSSLAAYLRATAQVSLAHIEQGSFVDFIQNIPSPSPNMVLKLTPLPGRVLLSVGPTMATIAIDRLLGGFGHAMAEDDHEITDIEISLLDTIVRYVADALEEAWRNVINLKPSVMETTLNPEFAQVALPTDAAIFVGFEVKIREGTGMMSICIPYSVLKPIVSELSPHTWVAGETKDSGLHRDGLESHLRRTDVDVSVLLGDMTVNFEDLLNLQVGDVLALETTLSRALAIQVGGRKQYLGQPGLVGKQMAVQILEVLEEVEENG